MTVTRVASADGMEIAWFTSGDGPPLLLVHGSLGDHKRWGALRPHLEPHFTVHAVDRRGRGASGDAREYALEREFKLGLTQSEDDHRRVLAVLAYLRASAAPSRY